MSEEEKILFRYYQDFSELADKVISGRVAAVPFDVIQVLGGYGSAVLFKDERR